MGKGLIFLCTKSVLLNLSVCSLLESLFGATPNLQCCCGWRATANFVCLCQVPTVSPTWDFTFLSICAKGLMLKKGVITDGGYHYVCAEHNFRHPCGQLSWGHFKLDLWGGQWVLTLVAGFCKNKKQKWWHACNEKNNTQHDTWVVGMVLIELLGFSCFVLSSH